MLRRIFNLFYILFIIFYHGFVTGGTWSPGLEIVKNLLTYGEEVRVLDQQAINWVNVEVLGNISVFKVDAH